MAWFTIWNDKLWDEDELAGTPWTSGGNMWGWRIGGKWGLDYYFKIAFDLSDEDWFGRCNNLKTNKDLYELFDWLGVKYEKDGILIWKGKKYNKKTGEEII